MRSVLFVCLGNICRSPLAEAIFQKQAEDLQIDIFVDSAGTGGWHTGEPPCEHSITVASQHGLDINGLRARQVAPDDESRFDYVIGLDQHNVANLLAVGFTNVRKLGDYGLGGEDVPDPYFFPGLDGFEKVFNMINECCFNLCSEMKNTDQSI